MVDSDETEFGYLLRFLQTNHFKVVLVDGQRGVGKSTLVKRLMKNTNAAYYKTWGKNQKDDRFAISELGLDLPQATYFVLDYLSQVVPVIPVICDRASVTSLAYQQRQYLFGKSNLHKYYVDLMARSGTVLLLLETDEKEIARRRVARGKDDEQDLCTLSDASVQRYVKKDAIDYERAMNAMEKAGLECVVTYELDVALCNCYISSKLACSIPLEDSDATDSENS